MPGARPNRTVAKLAGKDKRVKRWMLIWAQHGLCPCGDLVSVEVDTFHPLFPSLDHIRPWAHGGGNGIDNLIVKHRRCNDARRAKPASQADLDMQAYVAKRLAQPDRPRSMKEARARYLDWLRELGVQIELAWDEAA